MMKPLVWHCQSLWSCDTPYPEGDRIHSWYSVSAVLTLWSIFVDWGKYGEATDDSHKKRLKQYE